MVPLRAMVVTTLESGTSEAHSTRARAPAMATLRNIRWLDEAKSAASPSRSWPDRTRCGSRSRRNRLVVAWTLMWTSSPMAMPWAASEKTSTGPERARAAASTGPRASRRKRSRSTAGGESTPNHGAWPEPWLRLE